jgi:hypothetical protein
VSSDFPIRQWEIVEGVSCGCGRVLTRDLKRGSALQAKEREGPGDSGRVGWPFASSGIRAR